MSSKSILPRVVGKYGEWFLCPKTGEQKVRLTAEGKVKLAELMRKHPHPIALLRTAWPSMLTLCRKHRITDEEIDSACMEGMVKGFIRYRETGVKIETVLAWSLRGAIADLIRRREREKESCVSDHWETSADNGISLEPRAPDKPDELDLADQLRRLLSRARLTTREASILVAKVQGGETLVSIGEQHRISKERARQIVERALRKIRRASGIVTPDEVRREMYETALGKLIVRRMGRENLLTAKQIAERVNKPLGDVCDVLTELVARGEVEKRKAGKGQRGSWYVVIKRARVA